MIRRHRSNPLLQALVLWWVVDSKGRSQKGGSASSLHTVCQASRVLWASREGQ